MNDTIMAAIVGAVAAIVVSLLGAVPGIVGIFRQIKQDTKVQEQKDIELDTLVEKKVWEMTSGLLDRIGKENAELLETITELKAQMAEQTAKLEQEIAARIRETEKRKALERDLDQISYQLRIYQSAVTILQSQLEEANIVPRWIPPKERKDV